MADDILIEDEADKMKFSKVMFDEKKLQCFNQGLNSKYKYIYKRGESRESIHKNNREFYKQKEYIIP